MRDIHFGSDDAVRLTVRLFSPLIAQQWNGWSWVFSWSQMRNPRTWWRLLRETWDFHVHGSRHANHRCWCPVGTLLDGRLVAFGFGVTWFFHSYRGPVPCPCDEAIAELFPDEDPE